MKTKNYNISKLIPLVFMLMLVSVAPLAAQSQDAGLQQALDRAASAGVDADRLELIRERAEARGVDEAMLARLIEPVAGLAQQNMPSDFALQKLMEGLAKGVPPAMMVPVIESIYQQTPRAVAMAGQWMGRAEVAPFMEAMGAQQAHFRQDLVNAGLKSLTQQVSPETVEALLNELGSAAVLERPSPQAVAAAIGILPDLPESARNDSGVQQILAKAVAGGFSAADMQRLPGALNAAERRSQLPAASVLEGMSHQLGGGVPANQILQNLFNGNINAGPPAHVPGRPDNRPGRPGGRPRNGGN